MILVVYLGLGIFHPVAALLFSKSVFGRGLELPNGGTLRKKRGTARVASLVFSSISDIPGSL